MSCVAVITARGGSKRIPRKNIRKFCGKPIIAYSIEVALESQLFDEVMVSTDDKEIAEISKKYGAVVPFMRSEKTSSDYATTKDVLVEVLDTYKSIGKEFDYMCCLYPTAPFITADTLVYGINRLKETKADCLEPVAKYKRPLQSGFRVNDDGYLEYLYPEFAKEDILDTEPLYYDVGQFYWYNVKEYFFLGKKELDVSTIIIPEEMVQDIDDESDWAIAEMKYTLLHKK